MRQRSEVNLKDGGRDVEYCIVIKEVEVISGKDQ